MILVANDKIDDEVFITLLCIRKKNRADGASIYKEIKKYLDSEGGTKEFLYDKIHTLIND